MKVFITGINSFVGKRLTEKLDNLSIPYHGIDISGAYSTKVKKLSLNSNNLIKSIENNTSDVVHLAAISREQDCVNNEIKCFDVNISGTINLMDAIIKKKMKSMTKTRQDKTTNTYTGCISDESSSKK